MSRLGEFAIRRLEVIVRDLVAEMAEQRAIRLAHLMAAALALGVVGLGEIDGDEPVVVSGEHRLGAVGEKIEGEAVRILEPGDERQAQLQERVEQAVLRGLQHAPMDEVVRQRQVGDGAVVPACRTERFGAVDRDQPVADPVDRNWRNSDSAGPDTASAVHSRARSADSGRSAVMVSRAGR